MIKKYSALSKGKLIVVDIQPEYQKNIDFSIEDFVEYLKTKNNVLYLYNGESLGMSSETELTYWLLENGLEEENLNQIEFIDKGYAFFRAWMDTGIDDSVILKTLRHMVDNDLTDSRDIPEEDWGTFLSEEEIDELNSHGFIDGDPLIVPDISEEVLHRFQGAELVGGHREECLKEVKIWFAFHKMKLVENDEFIYG
ncbi:MAG: hypothetical protein WC511_02505 [Candidatus Pacearchaeota archaeon]